MQLPTATPPTQMSPTFPPAAAAILALALAAPASAQGGDFIFVPVNP